MAETCGIVHLPRGELAPLTASSRGLGEAMRIALDEGCSELVLGIGGSASTDGGTGMLAALGVRLLDRAGHEIPDGAEGLDTLASVDLSGLHPRLREVAVTVACDVNNPLLGDRGTSAVFGPQKGVTAQLRPRVDAGLERLADLLTRATGRDERDRPGAGAAGGVGYAALQVLQATMRPGVELVLDLVGFPELASGADLVITGEGSWTSSRSWARRRWAWPMPAPVRACPWSPSAAAASSARGRRRPQASGGSTPSPTWSRTPLAA